jgi:hypothetical protein
VIIDVVVFAIAALFEIAGCFALWISLRRGTASPLMGCRVAPSSALGDLRTRPLTTSPKSLGFRMEIGVQPFSEPLTVTDLDAYRQRFRPHESQWGEC